MALFALSIIPFIKFMFSLGVSTLVRCLIPLAAASVLYSVSTRKLTHPKGYTAFQAIEFYKLCSSRGFTKPELCRKNPEKFKSVAAEKEYLNGLVLSELFEAYEIGYELSGKKKG